MASTGRNEPCPCGSGKKYKKCCLEIEVPYRKPLKRDNDVVPIGAVGDYGVPLTDNAFFENNSVHELSALRLLYSLLLEPELEKIANSLVRQTVHRGQKELENINKTDDIKGLIDILKSNPDSLNQIPLVEKIVQYQHTAIPLILLELRESQNDSFIELSIRILHRNGINYSTEIINIIKNGHNRSAYCIAVLCVLLGFYDNQDSEKLLWDMYHHLKKHFPHETYLDGPLLGLSEMRERKREKILLN